MSSDPLLTVAELADVLRMHPESIRSAVRAGKIPVVRMGPLGRMRFDLGQVLRALGRQPDPDPTPAGSAA